MRIQLVMAEDNWRGILLKILLGEGWLVEVHTTIGEALSCAMSKGVPDLIILGQVSINLDSWRLCHLLKTSELEILNKVPVIVASLLPSDGYGKSIIKAFGADGYIDLGGKPETVVSTVRKTSPEQSRRSEVGSVLIVDDDPVIRHLLKQTYANYGWKVDTAITVSDGQKLLRLIDFDLVIIDHCLPDGCGDKLLDTIRDKQGATASIMITATASPELVVDWLEKGASAYLKKPFSPDDLYETGMRCLRENVWREVEKQLEERAHQLKLKELFIEDFENSIVDVFWVRDMNLSYQYVSPSIADLLGYSQEEAYQLDIVDEMTPDSLSCFRKAVEQQVVLLREGYTENAESKQIVELYHKSGRSVWAEIRMKMKTDSIGNPIGLSGITKDLTREKDKEEKLESLHSAIRQADDVIVVTDVHGNIEFANEAFEKVTGYAVDLVLGQNMRFLKSGIHDESFYKNIWSTIKGGDIWTGQITNRRKDGSLYHERVKISPIRNSNGEICRFVAVKHDLTQELALLHEKEEIEAKYMHAQKLEVIGSLAAGIIHDFNNILTPIVGYANLIKLKYQGDTAVRDHIDQILLAGDRAKGLINQILSFSRVDKVQSQELNVRVLIKECVKMAEAFFPPKIKIHCHLQGEYSPIKMDPTRFSQLLMNLMTNSFHAMEKHGGELNIFLEEELSSNHQQKIKMTVRDTGEGIPDHLKDKIFEPFFTTKQEGKGTGLGLAAAKTIVEEAGGEIFLESSEAGRGTSFVIFLDGVSKGGRVGKKIDNSMKKFDGKQKRVLLVDDDKIVLDYLSTALQRLNFKVDSYLDSSKALQVFSNKKEQYQLLFTDIEMPNKDGLELITNIRQLRNDLPIVVCTGTELHHRKHLVDDLQQVNLITKPVTLDQVSTAMAELFS